MHFLVLSSCLNIMGYIKFKQHNKSFIKTFMLSV